MNDMAGKLAYYRTLAGLTQAELAQKIGVTTAQISKYETGKATPRPAIRAELANVLGIKASELIPVIDKSWSIKVKAQMKLQKISQLDLAKKLGVAQSSVANWLNGKRLVDYSIINNILKAVGLSELNKDGTPATSKITDIIGGRNSPPLRLIIKGQAKQQTREVDFRFLPIESKELIESFRYAVLNCLNHQRTPDKLLMAIINQLDLIEVKLTFRSESNNLPEENSH